MKLSALAEALGSKAERSNQDLEVTGISTLDDACETEITFITEPRFLSRLTSSKARAVIIPSRLAPINIPYIPVDDVWSGVLKALKLFFPNFARKTYAGIHATAVVDPTCQVAHDVTIGPFAVVGPASLIAQGTYIGPGVVIGARCSVGENSIIYANAVLEPGSIIGSNVIIQPGAVIGADGFKYELMQGRWTKIPQVGHVELEANVEVGANSCIDRASYTRTSVAENTKIDNLVQIGHNAHIGQNCVVVAQSGIAGSTTVGNNTILAAQTGIADNLKIGNNVVILAQSGVSNNVADGETRMGYPARPFPREARVIAVTAKLPELAKEVSRLTQKVAELEAMIKK